jgi:hypothetical protein
MKLANHDQRGGKRSVKKSPLVIVIPGWWRGLSGEVDTVQFHTRRRIADDAKTAPATERSSTRAWPADDGCRDADDGIERGRGQDSNQ